MDLSKLGFRMLLLSPLFLILFSHLPEKIAVIAIGGYAGIVIGAIGVELILHLWG